MDANIIIIGGGCAGLQLVNSLLQLPYEQTGDILLIDKQFSRPQKSWCFWTKENTEYDFLVSKKWHKIRFSSTNLDLTQSIFPYQYNYIKSEDFFDYHHQLLDHSKRVRLITAEVNQIVPGHHGVQVVADQKSYTANRVYDSRIDFAAIPAEANMLWQHFKGYFIETEKNVFDTDTATIMDFNVDQADAAHFVYILPFTANTALVEFTAFSSLDAYPEDVYDAYLKTYLAERFQTEYQITGIESGKIPMSDYNFNAAASASVMPIGSAAGAIKPTTGYAFNRIRKDTRDLMDEWRNPELSRRGVFRKKRFRFYDHLFLKIIRDEPQRVRQVMERLFKNNAFSTILDFLDETSSLKQELIIFSRLPIRLFLKQVYKYVFSK